MKKLLRQTLYEPSIFYRTAIGFAYLALATLISLLGSLLTRTPAAWWVIASIPIAFMIRHRFRKAQRSRAKHFRQ